MGINGCIPRSTSQVFVLTVRDVEMSLRVTVLLGKTEINDIDLVTTFTNSHEEVVRLDITVDKRFGMNVLNTGDELISQQQNRLQRELAVAEVEKILQAGSKEIKNHGIVITFSSEPTDKWDANTTCKGLIDACLILKLWVLGLDALKLDGNLLSRDNVCSEVNISETAAADLTANPVFVTYAKILKQIESVQCKHDDYVLVM